MALKATTKRQATSLLVEPNIELRKVFIKLIREAYNARKNNLDSTYKQSGLCQKRHSEKIFKKAKKNWIQHADDLYLDSWGLGYKIDMDKLWATLGQQLQIIVKFWKKLLTLYFSIIQTSFQHLPIRRNLPTSIERSKSGDQKQKKGIN